ncbi:MULTISPECIES: GNAT family N-acetyltransferase [unclassified Bacillus cereus group]|uniref:GNAT family N-acetyltransferase n=1 Tax=unclassified Bacillus cereus group TaxID=2750818 RepID=UPI0022DEA145|nr:MULTISPECIES: GNAT family N-acetyltransferase [unclassified Bacillus cereus group]MDA1535759.1 GNAT family N-acetyltransferase [Bacillus cereus group sp. TH254-2LC]MDA1580298.1 GNAT family N-acetyltransferase [Bacillus cereus group sp. TH228LC]
MEIRLLTTEDAEIYLKVCMEGLTKNPEAFSSSYEDVLKHEDPVAAMAKRLSNPDKYTLGVFKDNDLIGIATLETKPFIKQEHKAKICSVFVSPKARGLGAGRALIKAIIENADKLHVEQLMLDVVVGNDAAKKLYESLGFQTYGVQERSLKHNGQYWDEEHMVLFLND